jgi:hypothetical protein
MSVSKKLPVRFGCLTGWVLVELPAMCAEYVAAIALCEECRRIWLADQGRWQVHWIDDGPEEKLVFYCMECAEREFGDRHGRSN